MPLNGSHVALGGTAVAALTQIYIYLTHWPLAAMDEPTAGAFAALTLLIIGGGIGALAPAEPDPPAVEPVQPTPIIIDVGKAAAQAADAPAHPAARPPASPFQTVVVPVSPNPTSSGAPTK